MINTSIDKYFYTMLNSRLDSKIRLVYSKVEEVDNVKDIKHEYARECLRQLINPNGIEIIISSDIPARGSGLGTSSSTTVGLLHTLGEYLNFSIHKIIEKGSLSSGAYQIEHDILGYPCGKQDQISASYGGFNYIQFNPNETVEIHPIKISLQKKQELENSLMLFYTGISRKSSVAAKRVAGNIGNKFATFKEMKEQALYMKDKLESNFAISDFGWELNKEWCLKRETASISTPEIDKIYEKATKAGIYGGKLCGSGLGGFMLFCCEPERQDKLRKALPNLREFKFKFDEDGSKILYNSWR